MLKHIPGIRDPLFSRSHTAIFPGEPGFAGCPLILLLHLFLDCTSFSDRPKLFMLFLTQSHQVFFGRPLCLIPSTSHGIQRLTQSLSSFRSTYPNHPNLLFYFVLLSWRFGVAVTRVVGIESWTWTQVGLESDFLRTWTGLGLEDQGLGLER